MGQEGVSAQAIELFDYLISDIDKQDIVTFREPKRSRSGLWELFQF